MRATNLILGSVGTLAAAALLLGVAQEREAARKLSQENSAWRQALSEADGLLAEKQRLSNLLGSVNGSSSRLPGASLSASEERANERVRLRGEVAALRQQCKEIEALREDTRQLRSARASGRTTQNVGAAARTSNEIGGNEPQIEILKADYWTDKTNLDVAAELQDRIRNGRLRTIASNSLKGDPEFGQVKHLTVVYRAGGITRTNEFREGEIVILPRD